MNEQSAKSLQEQMAMIRRELDHDVSKVVRRAQELTDWRFMVKKHPWLAIGVAAAAGYFLVPQRRQLVRPSADELAKMVNRDGVRLKAEGSKAAKAGIAATVLSALVPLATRWGTNAAKRYASNFFAARSSNAAPHAAPTAAASDTDVAANQRKADPLYPR